MNNIERAMNILHYKPVDRLPAVHFGYWHELLEEWAAQKKIPLELANKKIILTPRKTKSLINSSDGISNGTKHIHQPIIFVLHSRARCLILSQTVPSEFKIITVL